MTGSFMEAENVMLITDPTIAISQYRNILIFEKRNIRDGVSGQVAGTSRLVASPHSQATFQGSGSYVVFDWGKEFWGILSLTINNATAQSQFSLSLTDLRRQLQNWDVIQTFHAPLATGLLAQTVGQQCGGLRFLTIVSASADPLAITFMPHWDDLKAYPGYFYAPNPGFHDIDFLAKILYAGTYTVQNNTIPPRMVRQGPWPAGGGWSNNALGGSVIGPILVDGAKRDRNIWPGNPSCSGPRSKPRNHATDQATAKPTTGALQYSGPLLNNQGSDKYISSSLIGTHNYFLYVGDLDFVKSVWPNYTKAVGFLEGQVDSTGLMTVPSSFSNDWGRAGGAGNRSQTLVTATDLATHLGNVSLAATYLANATKMQTALNSLLWDAAEGLFRENDVPTSIYPQAGNAFAVLYNLTTSDAQNKALLAKFKALDELHNIDQTIDDRWAYALSHAAAEYKDEIAPLPNLKELHGGDGVIGRNVDMGGVKNGYGLGPEHHARLNAILDEIEPNFGPDES
ncbi:unnamed protein product [Mycena citricolor]|uniref:Uncharacterized protein n=1 Tax=Mycena citricolor TaxID=2018698 RepID=A0AAD2H7R2_9AGAR|nr:unnamed protein product [Mycena citricolor]